MKLFDLEKKRGFLGAVGFYLLVLLISLVVVFVLGYLVSQGRNVEEAQKYGAIVGKVVGVAVPLLLVLLIFKKKNLWKNRLAVVAGVLGLILAVFVGLIMALLPVAFLTTVDSKK